MKKNFFNILMLITSLLIVFLFLNCPNPDDTPDMEPSDTEEHGYPADFPLLMDTGGKGEGYALFGFGGLLYENGHHKNMQENRAAVQLIPVILLHGMGSDTDDMQTLRDFLKNTVIVYDEEENPIAYNDAEIWAVSYLGEDPEFNIITESINHPHTKNIDDVRLFIDTVISYLNVKRVIIIGHSLGAGMARAYLNGLIRDDDYVRPPGYTGYNIFNARWGKVAAIITLAGANYGLGTEENRSWYKESKIGDLYTSSAYENDTHYFPVSLTFDDTPYGAREDEIDVNDNEAIDINLPSLEGYYDYASEGGKFGTTTSLDNGVTRIYYGCAKASGDNIVKLSNSGYLQGADLNKEFIVPGTIITPGFDDGGHKKIVKSEQVFNDAILPILIKANIRYPDNEK